jgi:hypothetical protein
MESRTVAVGFLTGLIHHIFIQYPKQMPLQTTLLAFLLFEVTIGSIVVSKMGPLAESLASFLAISLIYVPNLLNF